MLMGGLKGTNMRLRVPSRNQKASESIAWVNRRLNYMISILIIFLILDLTVVPVTPSWWYSFNSDILASLGYFIDCLLLFGRYIFSLQISNSSSTSLPLQFPFTRSLQKLLTTRNAWVFRQKSRTLGLSWDPPLCLWQPKNFSRGSWHILLLKKHFTPGRVKRYLTNSTNEWAAAKFIWDIISMFSV